MCDRSVVSLSALAVRANRSERARMFSVEFSLWLEVTLYFF